MGQRLHIPGAGEVVVQDAQTEMLVGALSQQIELQKQMIELQKEVRNQLDLYIRMECGNIPRSKVKLMLVEHDNKVRAMVEKGDADGTTPE